ncbi:iron complex transport system ATP-binding protein [Austwickia chelonae]|uniref:Putative iron-siderophore ABC transporter ATP-binding protein n=1 Tax=Austwickia chelonae NBRC 105200 TaxID=1184607 RepID=K6WBV3_9MICO|nr:ABC transporter ATP-binding protein [Austwickia chelonae]GAB79312.1 putative iron-siderophore ABC transporter ATP-binding protein [Austwickia chelonae NBRC 105200]SEW38200.1 iron complex transport system ATP-binding protein [Austwickia chelonae]
MTLAAHDVHLGYEGRPVVTGLDLALPLGRLTVFIGPNGCGKSTLLRGLAGQLPPTAGHCAVDDRPLSELTPTERARTIGLLPQAPVVPEGLTVAELVARGRHPHRGMLRRWSATDAAAVDQALSAVDLHPLAERPVEALSGGQRQRAWIALVLAQQTPYLLLDEPTTFLDLAHAMDVMDVARQAALSGTTVVLVQHDLTLAARYAHHLVVMQDGGIAAQGAPGEVLTSELLKDVFGLAAHVQDVGGAPAVVPVAR